MSENQHWPDFGPMITVPKWAPCELVTLVPDEAMEIQYGVSLVGDGRVWVDNVSIEVVSPRD